VCIDEPENHLHPQLQRDLLPRLLDAFPDMSFIVATHSPFIVTAVRESNVYVLDYDGHDVVSRLLESANKAASSDETLRRVLGLETTLPLWLQRAVADVLGEWAEQFPTPSALRSLHDRMAELGLDVEFPAALDALIGEQADARTD
jgi:hypothetical protein